MPGVARAYDLVAVILSYPAEGGLPLTEALEAIEPACADAARALALFAGRVGGLELDELRELFISTFDLNPICSLEVGWHLYGDSYDRGQFLVKARALLRACGVPESSELPDHLAHLLRAYPRLDAPAARDVAETAILPAVDRMRGALSARKNPYGHVLDAVGTMVAADAGLVRTDGALAAARLPFKSRGAK